MRIGRRGLGSRRRAQIQAYSMKPKINDLRVMSSRGFPARTHHGLGGATSHHLKLGAHKGRAPVRDKPRLRKI